MLTHEQRERLDTKITITEYFRALKSFEKNKTPGNDRLTAKFYLAFWDLVGECLGDAFNFAQEQGQFSTFSETSYDYFARKERQRSKFFCQKLEANFIDSC